MDSFMTGFADELVKVAKVGTMPERYAELTAARSLPSRRDKLMTGARAKPARFDAAASDDAFDAQYKPTKRRRPVRAAKAPAPKKDRLGSNLGLKPRVSKAQAIKDRSLNARRDELARRPAPKKREGYPRPSMTFSDSEGAKVTARAPKKPGARKPPTFGEDQFKGVSVKAKPSPRRRLAQKPQGVKLEAPETPQGVRMVAKPRKDWSRALKAGYVKGNLPGQTFKQRSAANLQTEYGGVSGAPMASPFATAKSTFSAGRMAQKLPGGGLVGEPRLKKAAAEESTARRKAKAAAKGAAIGVGSSLGLPALAALLISKRGNKLRDAGAALRVMTGRRPKGYKKMDRWAKDMDDEFAEVGGKITGAAGMTGAGLGALLG